MEKITVRSPLTFRNALLFPVQDRAGRRDVCIGALWMLALFPGWILNMGHRIQMVHNMHRGAPPAPAWNGYGRLVRSGLTTFFGMVYYYLPGATLLALAYYRYPILYVPGTALLVLATLAIPGYMTHYCRELDGSEIFNPLKALKRVREGGALYWEAWAITLSALALSFVGLLGFGIGFFFTSVWFWQTAGFSFACVFTQKHKL